MGVLVCRMSEPCRWHPNYAAAAALIPRHVRPSPEPGIRGAQPSPTARHLPRRRRPSGGARGRRASSSSRAASSVVGPRPGRRGGAREDRVAAARRRARRRADAEARRDRAGAPGLGARRPETAIVLYTGYGDARTADGGARRRRGGFVLKEAPLDDLLRGRPSRSPRGGTYVDPVLAGVLATATARPAAAEADPARARRARACSRTASRTRRSASGSSSRPRPCARTCARRWTSSTRTTRTQAVATALRQQLIA